ncbi:iron complex transport system substrate-binding protein [Herbihabitans rhizosphaerae]|uniref:Iron complex transport system substrate-binding protein n=1 Tax=Herbihabitans rhizosphaerae TaxID=1872711 RepID=A0A4Q7KJ75_9PSEU|nr:ABC transporter substrate-binding protein [Herbihabitans rhizosphaerae]RZS34285.1 iron complex transport system substrate-binding protein [Herbihabitans rhizosphaerae]
MSRARHPLTRLLVALLALVALAGCAAREQAAAPGAGQNAGTPEAAFPVQLTVPGGKPVVLDHKPKRIVSLNPAATEVLFTMGAGEQVVAVDSQSNFPQRAPRTALSALTPNVEAIANYKPDLVILFSDPGGLADSLEKLHIPTIRLASPKTTNEAYAYMRLLGQATGHAKEGSDLADRTKADIEKLVAETPKPARPLSYYFEIGPDLYSLTSKTMIGQLVSQFGLANVADPAGAVGEYPQLSPADLVRANPDLIFLADTVCCQQNAQTIAARPGWNRLKAVTGGNVVELNDDLATRWGPRVVEALKAVSAAVTKAGKA